MGILDRIRGWLRSDDLTNSVNNVNLVPNASFGGWQNVFTGFGTTRDKASYQAFAPIVKMPDVMLRDLYYGYDIAAKIVDLKVREAFRVGYDFDTEISDETKKKAKTLRLDERLQEAVIWGRLYGGALLILGADDAQDPIAPLNEDNISDIRFLSVVDRRYVTVMQWYTDPMQPNYGFPMVYRVQHFMTGATTYVHESRCWRFEGTPVDPEERRKLDGWSYSVLQRPYETMQAFSATFQSASNLVQDASQAVFKLSGLLQQIASGNKDDLVTRMQMVDMTRSTARAVMLDADTESFERVNTTFSGLSDVLDRFMMRVASAAETPVTILFGRSPAGLNATGESDTRMFYDGVQNEQNNRYKPMLEWLYSKIEGDEIKICFRPLWQMTAKEEADLKLAHAQRDAIYLDREVLRPEEVALARFGENGYEYEVIFDEDSIKIREETLANPPEEPVVTPNDPNQANQHQDPNQPGGKKEVYSQQAD